MVQLVPFNVCSLYFTLYTKQLFHFCLFGFFSIRLFFLFFLHFLECFTDTSSASRLLFGNKAAGCVWSWVFLRGGGRKRNKEVFLESGPVWGVQSKVLMVL